MILKHMVWHQPVTQEVAYFTRTTTCFCPFTYPWGQNFFSSPQPPTRETRLVPGNAQGEREGMVTGKIETRIICVRIPSKSLPFSDMEYTLSKSHSQNFSAGGLLNLSLNWLEQLLKQLFGFALLRSVIV